MQQLLSLITNYIYEEVFNYIFQKIKSNYNQLLVYIFYLKDLLSC